MHQLQCFQVGSPQALIGIGSRSPRMHRDGRFNGLLRWIVKEQNFHSMRSCTLKDIILTTVLSRQPHQFHGRHQRRCTSMCPSTLHRTSRRRRSRGRRLRTCNCCPVSARLSTPVGNASLAGLCTNAAVRMATSALSAIYARRANGSAGGSRGGLRLSEPPLPHQQGGVMTLMLQALPTRTAAMATTLWAF